MPKALFTFALKPGVTVDAYETWLETRDRPLVRGMMVPDGPIVSQTVFRTAGAVFMSNTSYSYVEIIEFTEKAAYLETLSTHLNAATIVTELAQYAQVVDNVFIDPVF